MNNTEEQTSTSTTQHSPEAVQQAINEAVEAAISEMYPEVVATTRKYQACLYKFIQSLVSSLPQFYHPRIKTVQKHLDKFEDVAAIPHTEFMETNLYSYISEFVDTLAPFSTKFTNTNLDLFNRVVYVSIVGDVDAESKVFHGVQIDFCSLWEDVEVTEDTKKKILINFSVLYKLGCDVIRLSEKMISEESVIKTQFMMDNGMTMLDTKLEETFDGDELEKMRLFFEGTVSEVTKRRITPQKLISNLMQGDLKDLEKFTEGLSKKMEKSGLTEDFVREGMTKLAENSKGMMGNNANLMDLVKGILENGDGPNDPTEMMQRVMELATESDVDISQLMSAFNR